MSAYPVRMLDNVKCPLELLCASALTVLPFPGCQQEDVWHCSEARGGQGWHARPCHSRRDVSQGELAVAHSIDLSLWHGKRQGKISGGCQPGADACIVATSDIMLKQASECSVLYPCYDVHLVASCRQCLNCSAGPDSHEHSIMLRHPCRFAAQVGLTRQLRHLTKLGLCRAA